MIFRPRPLAAAGSVRRRVVRGLVRLRAARRYGGFVAVRRPAPDTFKGDFVFCRLAFRSAYGGYGGGWGVDYPRADQNLSIRLSELSEAAVNFEHDGSPNYVVIQATEPELFKCPFVALTNHGRASFTPDQIEPLREYLKKGGFLWADDAWGSYAWDHWLGELRKILPAAEYPLVDLPINHSIFRTLFEAKRIPQIPNIGFYRGTGQTSEQWQDSAVASRLRASRLPRPHRRPDDAQYRFRRRIRARVGRSGVLLQVFGRRICDRDQHSAVCDDALAGMVQVDGP